MKGKRSSTEWVNRRQAAEILGRSNGGHISEILGSLPEVRKMRQDASGGSKTVHTLYAKQDVERYAQTQNKKKKIDYQPQFSSIFDLKNTQWEKKGNTKDVRVRIGKKTVKQIWEALEALESIIYEAIGDR